MEFALAAPASSMFQLRFGVSVASHAKRTWANIWSAPAGRRRRLGAPFLRTTSKASCPLTSTRGASARAPPHSAFRGNCNWPRQDAGQLAMIESSRCVPPLSSAPPCCRPHQLATGELANARLRYFDYGVCEPGNRAPVSERMVRAHCAAQPLDSSLAMMRTKRSREIPPFAVGLRNISNNRERRRHVVISPLSSL